MNRWWRIVSCLSGVVAVAAVVSGSEQGVSMDATNIYDVTMQTIDGKEKPLADYRGKALLIVNTASRCGFTPQYASLEKLYEQYRDRGFEILAFPANNFHEQEPGTNQEIKQFCELKFHTTFPLFAKISVDGSDTHPLYKYLTSVKAVQGPITWNFNKFLIGPDGTVMARFNSKTDPLDPSVIEKLNALLPKT